MKNIIIFTFLFFLVSCQTTQESKTAVNNTAKPDTLQHTQAKKHDSLFTLNIRLNENFVEIIPPENSDFELPDSSVTTTPYKFGDFNADNKEDILVYLGGCGTGGCEYGLFLNQNDNYYKLAFMNYLKNAEFKIEKNGLWTIKSWEEIEPYNLSKLQITIFKFDTNKYYYDIDSTYVYIDNEIE